MADSIGVMYLGKLVEVGPAEAICAAPGHPYTRGLIDAVPVVTPDPEAAQFGAGLSGEPPAAADPPSGCRFRTRCPRAQDICARQEPQLQPHSAAGQFVACHFPLREAVGSPPPVGLADLPAAQSLS
jgi:peptide/nickel transport system ATP-binding protein